MWHRGGQRLQKRGRSPEKEMSTNLYGRRGKEACHHVASACGHAVVSAQECPAEEGRSKIQQVVCSPVRPSPPRSPMGG